MKPATRRVGARRGSWTVQGTSRWQAWDAGYFARLVGFSSLAGLLFTRFAEWKGGSASSFFPLDRLALDASGHPILAVLLVANALVLDRSLAGRVPVDRVPLSVRALLLALAALPIVGLLAWPAWQRLARSTGGGEPARLDLGGAGFESPLLGIDRVLVRGRERMECLIAWLVLGQLAPFLALLSWLAAPAPAGAIGTAAAPVGRALLSLAGFASAWIYVLGTDLRAAKPLRRLLHRALPFTYVLPGAWPLLAIPLWLPFAREIREEATLVHAVYDRRHRASSPPLEPNRTERRREVLATLAVGLLPFESAPFGAWIGKAGWTKYLGPTLLFVVALYGIGALALALLRFSGAGSAHRRAAFAHAVPRAALLVAAPLLATAGLYSGIYWAEGNPIVINRMAILVALLTPTFLILTALADYALRLPDPEGGGLRAGHLLLGILAAFTLSAGVAWIAKTHPYLLPYLPILALVVRGLLIASVGRRSLRPARVADLVDSRLPQRARLALAGLFLATTAPLGGLVLPALSFLPTWRTEMDRSLLRVRLALDAPESSPPDDAKERARRVDGRRKRVRHDLRGGGPWRHFDLEFSGGITSMILLAGLLLGESQLWPEGYSPISFSPTLAQSIGVVSLAFLPVQAWLMDRYLSAKTPFPKSLPSLWIAARRLVAAIPGLGLVLIPAWRRLVERKFSTPPPPALDAGQRSRSTFEAATERSMRHGSVGLVTAASFLPLGGLSIWLAVRAPLGVTLVVFAVVHLVAAFLIRRELVRKATTEPGNPGVRRERALLPLLALLPMPLGVLPWVARIFLSGERRPETLVWSVYVRRQAATVALTVDARGERQATPTTEGLAAAGYLSFLRWKSLLVAFDALALGGALCRHLARADLGGWVRLRPWSGLSLFSVGPLDVTVFALGAAILGLAILGASRLARLSGCDKGLEQLGIPDAARTTFLTQSAAALGLILAPLVATDRMREFVMLAALGLACVAIVGFLLLMPGSAASRRPGWLRHMRWLFLYLGLLGTLALLARPLTRPGAGPTLLIGLGFALPVLHIVLYRAGAIWFLRPWQKGSLRDPALPWTLRLAGGFLQATAALPLGGLVLPAAILLRSGLRPRWLLSLRTSPARSA